eukprot:1866125-Lingulodinium_polyedra.AAC.1
MGQSASTQRVYVQQEKLLSELLVPQQLGGPFLDLLNAEAGIVVHAQVLLVLPQLLVPWVFLQLLLVLKGEDGKERNEEELVVGGLPEALLEHEQPEDAQLDLRAR